MAWKIREACPFKHKYELFNWACKRYPQVISARFSKMTKKQLYAIWYKS